MKREKNKMLDEIEERTGEQAIGVCAVLIAVIVVIGLYHLFGWGG